MNEHLARRGQWYLVGFAAVLGLLAVGVALGGGRPRRAFSPLLWDAILLLLALHGRRWAARVMATIAGLVIVGFGAGGVYGAGPSFLLAACFLAVTLGGLYFVHRFWTSEAVDAYFLRRHAMTSSDVAGPQP